MQGKSYKLDRSWSFCLYDDMVVVISEPEMAFGVVWYPLFLQDLLIYKRNLRFSCIFKYILNITS